MAATATCPNCRSEIPAGAPGGLCPDCLLQQGLDVGDSDSAALAETTPAGGRLVPPTVESLASLFPQFEILGLIGYGGMGAVYRARQRKLDRLVALKLIRPESATDPAFAERFMREARTLAKLSHPNIVAIHDFGEVSAVDAAGAVADATADGADRPSLYYFVMEYVDGANLRQLLSEGELQPSLSLSVIPQVCDALQYAHEEAVVHRDIKPENILIDAQGRVKIADFGLAKLAAGSPDNFTLTGTHQVMGTPRYMAPEQMEGSRSVDHRADIYSTGVVFYEMLTGEVPAGHFDPPSRRAAVDPQLDAIVFRALARDPGRRFQQAGELKSGITAVTFDVDRSARPVAAGPAGMSTIVEQEAAAAWRWMVGESEGPVAAGAARLPVIAMTLLSLVACLSVLLPWVDVDVVNAEAPAPAEQVADGADGDWTVCLLQEAEHSDFDAVFDFSPPGGVLGAAHVTIYGLEIWPGIVVCVVGGLLALYLIASPERLRGFVSWWLVAAVLGGILLLHTILFRLEIQNIRVSSSVASAAVRSGGGSGRTIASGVSSQPDGAAERETAEWLWCQTAEASDFAFASASRLADIPHRVTYRSGILTAFSAAIALLVLSATGTRHALAGKPQASSGAAPQGRPLASVRFTAPRSSAMGSMIRFHFGGLGYSLVSERPDAWVFQRGRPMAGLTEMDIRQYHTTLTVRTVGTSDGRVRVNCLWEVRTLGAWIQQKDTDLLESEGRELESLLASDRPPAAATGARLADVEAAEREARREEATVTPLPDDPGNERGPSGTESAASLAAAVGSAAQPGAAGHPIYLSSGVTSTAEPDLDALEARVDRPAVVMLAWGGLTALGSLIAFLITVTDRFTDDKSWFFLPGVVLGGIAVYGGIQMKRLRSSSLATLGAVATVIPATVAFPVSLWIGVWVLQVLNRKDVQNAFLIRARQRRSEPRSGEPRMSRKAIVGACLVPFFLPIAGAMMVSTVSVMPGGVQSHPGSGAGQQVAEQAGMTVLMLVLIVGFSVLIVPALTTLLGLMAMADIRRSRGMITGLGLAFTDAVLFPALLIDGLMLGALWLLLESMYPPREMLLATLMLMTALLLVATGLVLWWLWRKVSASVDAAATQPVTAPPV